MGEAEELACSAEGEAVHQETGVGAAAVRQLQKAEGGHQGAVDLLIQKMGEVAYHDATAEALRGNLHENWEEDFDFRPEVEV